MVSQGCRPRIPRGPVEPRAHVRERRWRIAAGLCSGGHGVSQGRRPRSRRAQGNLGQMYAKGQGVPQDYAAAAAWYRKSADQGLAISQNNLGTMYVSGQGVTRDYVQAHKWFNLAAERFTPSVIEGREFAVKNRDAVAAMMTSARGSAEARTRVGTKIRKLWAGNGPLHDLQEAGRSARPGSHIPERIGFQYAGKCQPLQINAP